MRVIDLVRTAGNRSGIAAASLALGALVGGCAPAGGDAALGTGQRDDEIQGGQLETGFPAVGLVSTSAGFCTGTLISPSFVLTAKHCAGSSMVFKTGTKPANFVSHTVDQQLSHSSKDLLLAHLAAPITNILPMAINAGSLPAVGTVCTAVGFGDHLETDHTTTKQVKRSATERVESADSTTIQVVMVSGIADHGDSGGPLLCGHNLINAVVHNHTDGDFPDHTHENYATTDVAWANTTQAGFEAGFTPFVTSTSDLAVPLNFGLPSSWLAITGDFNHDGSIDYARLGPTGAWVFRANRLSRNGVFDDPVFQNYNGLNFGDPAVNWPTITGDFNNDGNTDYARVGASGAFVYLANPSSSNGGFSEPGFQDFSHDGLNFGDPPVNWPIITGDFNHDGKTDYARVGATGAWVFLAGGGNAGFNEPMFENYNGLNFGDPATNWPTITGDFNHDGKTDYARVGSTGAFVFFAGGGNGGFNEAVFENYNGLNFGDPATNWQTVTGDFNGDGKTDYARLGSTGAWLFFGGGGNGGFNNPAFQTYDGLVFSDPSPWQPIVGDFVHDGKASYGRLGGDKSYVFVRF